MSETTIFGQRCPTCGRLMSGEIRHGVRIGVVKAIIFDIVSGRGDNGISSEALHAELVKEGHEIARQTLRTHVYQLRLALDATNLEVVSDTSYVKGKRRTVYRMRRRNQESDHATKLNGPDDARHVPAAPRSPRSRT